MEISAEVILILLISGLLVGFINTIAAGATAISISVFMLLGLPPMVANGTNRLPVVLQNMMSVVNFKRQNLLDINMGLKLSVPIIIGSIVGAMAASYTTDTIFKVSLGIVLTIILVFMIASPLKYLKGEHNPRPVTLKYYILFLLAGFYGGFIYVGLGYIVMAAAIAGLRLDIIRANAMKGFIALVTTPFALAVFMIEGNVNYTYGLIHAVGNIAGAYIASNNVTKFGVGFLKWFVIVFIAITIADLFGLISLKGMVSSIL